MQLARAKLNAFDSGHGWFFWNFRTEFEPRWDFTLAYDMGYFPADISKIQEDESVTGACTAEDNGEDEQPEPAIQKAVMPTEWRPALAFGAVFFAAAGMLLAGWYGQQRRQGYSRIGEESAVQMPTYREQTSFY